MRCLELNWTQAGESWGSLCRGPLAAQVSLKHFGAFYGGSAIPSHLQLQWVLTWGAPGCFVPLSPGEMTGTVVGTVQGCPSMICTGAGLWG